MEGLQKFSLGILSGIRGLLLINHFWERTNILCFGGAWQTVGRMGQTWSRWQGLYRPRKKTAPSKNPVSPHLCCGQVYPIYAEFSKDPPGCRSAVEYREASANYSALSSPEIMEFGPQTRKGMQTIIIWKFCPQSNIGHTSLQAFP